jgi:hypothetical protein
MFTGLSFEAVMLSLRYVFRFRFNNSMKTSKKCPNLISILFLRKKGCKVGNPTYFHLEK